MQVLAVDCTLKLRLIPFDGHRAADYALLHVAERATALNPTLEVIPAQNISQTPAGYLQDIIWQPLPHKMQRTGCNRVFIPSCCCSAAATISAAITLTLLHPGPPAAHWLLHTLQLRLTYCRQRTKEEDESGCCSQYSCSTRHNQQGSLTTDRS